MDSLSDRYRAFRCGRSFLVTLVLLIVVWLFVNHALYLFDPDDSHLNLTLSIEASVSVAFLLASQEKNDRLIREMLDRILADAEAIKIKEGL